MRKPESARERGLLKGAIRRIFSRSELRRQALAKNSIQHTDVTRPRVTRWGWCSECGTITPAYLLEVDHVEPLIPLDKSLEQMTWDEVVDRCWCSLENLRPVCRPCHKQKTKQEAKIRKGNKG